MWRQSMKNKWTYSLLFSLLLLFPTGCAEKEARMFMEQAMEGVAIGTIQGVTEAMTGDPELAVQAGQELQAKFDEQRQIKAYLEKLPAGWQCAGGDLYWSDSVECMVYSRPDQKWVKFNGADWIDPDTNIIAQPLIAVAEPVPNASSTTEAASAKVAAAVPQKA